MTDTDADEMPDGYEVTYGLAVAVNDAFEDKDGDRYPNIFEWARGSNPSDLQSTPTPSFVVDAADVRQAVEDCIEKSYAAVELMLRGDMDKALAKIHAKPPRPKPPKPQPPVDTPEP